MAKKTCNEKLNSLGGLPKIEYLSDKLRAGMWASTFPACEAGKMTIFPLLAG